MSLAGIEGGLRIRLGSGTAQLSSTRPLDGVRVFEGRGIAEVLALLPRLYAVCANAQTVAALGAVEAALERPAAPAVMRARRRVVAAETVREHLLRVLTGWAPLAGRPPPDRELQEVLSFPAQVKSAWFVDGTMSTPRDRPARAADARAVARLAALVEHRVLGQPLAGWLAAVGAGLTPAGAGLAPRYLAALQQQGWAGLGAAALDPLPALDAALLDERLTGAASSAAFVAAPDWRGRLHETGAFARMATHPAVRHARARHGAGIYTRSLARLVELAGLLGALAAGDDTYPVVAVAAPAPGVGIAQLEAARGRLVHRVAVHDGRVASYRVLAPTEWNFHPAGVAARALAALPAMPRLEEVAAELVRAVDPCVGFELELEAPTGRVFAKVKRNGYADACT
jgi:hypothetical protein